MEAGLSQSDRRSRDAQREAVERVLPDPDEGSVLRAASGEILVYDELGAKFNPINLRAVIMPDGTTVEFQTARFHRAR
ncbi:MAG TPA: hypothetical protein VF066_11660 [Thermoleophilaceae bacterium]